MIKIDFRPAALAVIVQAALCVGFFPGASLFVSRADAALCPDCRDLMFVDSAGTCSVCGAPTASGAMRLCPKCSARLHECEHCRRPITAADLVPPGATETEQHDAPRFASGGAALAPMPPTLPTSAQPLAVQPPVNTLQTPPPLPVPALPTRPVAQALPPAQQAPLAKPAPIDPRRPGLYLSGRWRYQLQINYPGTPNESRWGALSYDGQKLPHGDVNDYYRTPWGPIYWVGAPQAPLGKHGWMPVPQAQNRPGRTLAIPAAFLVPHNATPPSPAPSVANATPPNRQQNLDLNRTHNGQVAHVHVGNSITVRLPGNPASGYQWLAVVPRATNVPLASRPQYIAPSQSGYPGTFVFVYQPTQPGTGTIRIQYMRPGDTARPPAEVYAVRVDVQAAAH